jgi:hypothetical protein
MVSGSTEWRVMDVVLSVSRMSEEKALAENFEESARSRVLKSKEAKATLY